MWPNQQDFSKIPMAAGKTKMLWDAIRTAGVGPDGGPLPPGDPSEDAPPMGPANPVPPRPVPAAGPPSVETPAGPVAAPPPTPPPAPDALPSDARVGALQSQIDVGNQKPSLVQRLKSALPSLLVSGIGAALGGPSAAQGANASVQTQIAERDKQRAALIQQADSAQTTRAAEYGALQRANAQRDVAGTNVGGRLGVADINAGAKTDTANIGADARRDVVGTQGDTARDVANTRAGATTDAAHISAKARVQAAALTAQAYANRQSRGFDQQDHMQDRRESAQINKPTAAEDQRADYNKTLGENLDVLDELARRRGDMFGKVGGRVTNFKEWIGSDDPDVAVLKAAMGNVGTIVNATHGMRANAAVLRAQHDLANGNLNSAKAFQAAIQTLRDSGNTMNTYVRPTLTNTKTNTASPNRVPLVNGKTPPANNDPLGIR